MSGTHSSPQNVDQVFVEIIGVDGLAHHVGPFQSPAQAEEWIERNSTVERCPQQTPDQKVTFVIGGNVLLKPAD